MTCEVEELHNIAVSIMQQSEINVIIDNTLDTAMTDFKNIFVTIQLIPPELRKFKRVVSRIFDGQVAHEAGHIVITAPVKERLVQWIKCQNNPNLANIVHQSLEDKRVNHYIFLRYRFDFAYRLKLLADVSNRLWVDTLHMKMAEARNKRADLAMKPESFFINDMLIPLACLAGMWHWDVENEFQMDEEQKQFCRQATNIFDEARFDKMTMSIINRHQQLYNLFEAQINRTSENPQENCPKGIGGNLTLKSGRSTSSAISKMEKKLKKAEEEAEAEAKKENRGKKDDKDKGGMAAGAGSGLNIPTPIPNEGQYQKIVQRNREHIERLLNLLKKLATPKLITDKWRKQGRFMTEVLSKAYTASMRRPVTDVYSNRMIKLERAEACMGLLVDLSGSVSEEDAKNALAVTSEVCGRWLRDEDFAIMVFGSDYQKIKAFVEPYHTTRIRIGGVKCMGGTELYNPLSEMYKMLKAQHNGRCKVLAIVSDFYVSKPEECKKLIKTIENDEIHVIGLGIDSAEKSNTDSFTKKNRYIGSIKDLPEAFFDLYKESAL